MLQVPPAPLQADLNAMSEVIDCASALISGYPADHLGDGCLEVGDRLRIAHVRSGLHISPEEKNPAGISPASGVPTAPPASDR